MMAKARLEQAGSTRTRRTPEEGNNKHIARLVELEHWAEPLKAPEDSMTFHVIEAVSPEVASHAPCTVTVVRTRGLAENEG